MVLDKLQGLIFHKKPTNQPLSLSLLISFSTLSFIYLSLFIILFRVSLLHFSRCRGPSDSQVEAIWHYGKHADKRGLLAKPLRGRPQGSERWKKLLNITWKKLAEYLEAAGMTVIRQTFGNILQRHQLKSCWSNKIPVLTKRPCLDWTLLRNI